MAVHWVEPLLAGTAVVLSSGLARRLGGRWGGILAAAPITPTFAVLALGRGPEALLTGLPMVAVTALLIALLVGTRPRITPGLLWIGLGWTGLLVLAALSVKAPAAAKRPRGLAWPMRFLIGAGTVASVAWASHLAPSIAPYLAMAPWLFVAGVLAATADGGRMAGRAVLQGGAAGALGVGAFAWAAAGLASITSPLVALVGGWIAYAMTALAWSQWRGASPIKTQPNPDPWTSTASRN